eukprot:1059326-Lingulodinium_polyedra.AAC.1
MVFAAFAFNCGNALLAVRPIMHGVNCCCECPSPALVAKRLKASQAARSCRPNRSRHVAFISQKPKALSAANSTKHDPAAH